MSILTKQCDRGLDANITDATELPNGSAADGSQNVLYSKGTCATPYGFGKLGAALDSAVLLKGTYTELDKTQHLIAITKDKIYDRNFITALWDEKTKGYGTGPGTPVSLGGNINNPMSMASILHTDGLAIDNLAGDEIGYQHLIVCPGSSAAQATAELAPIQRWAGKNEYDFTDLLGADGYHGIITATTAFASIAGNGTVVTVTSNSHPFVVGDTVTIVGVANTYDETNKVITAKDANTFSYASTKTGTTTTGTARRVMTKHFATQVGSFYNRLLLINAKEYDVDGVLHENNQRVRWPMAGKLETGTAWSGTGSGFYDLLDTGGYNVWGALLGMQWIQYQNNSIWSLTHVGGTRVFEPNIEMPDLGLFGPHCLYSKNNQHFFLGNDLNVYAYMGGSNITRIGDKIQKYLQRDLDPTYANQCWMCMGSNNSRLWLFIVPKNSLYATQAYGMDMRTGVWQKRDFTHKWPTGGITSVALLAAGGYRAGETYQLYQNHITGDDGSHPVVSGASWLSQTFTTTTSHNATSVRLKLFKTAGTSPGTVTVSLRATSAGLPTGADLCVGTINGDDFTESTDGAWYRITFTSNPVLAGSTKYAIIVRSAAASIGWRWDSSSPAYSTGNNCFSLDSGATWPNKTGSISAVSVPSGNITAVAQATGSTTAFTDDNLQENYITGNDDEVYINGGSAIKLAQTFTPTVTHTITSVKLKLRRAASASGTATIDIINLDGNGHPTGAPLCSGTTDLSTLTTDSAGEWRTITIANGAVLTAGYVYAIVFNAPTGSGYYYWLADTTSPSYSGGSYQRSLSGVWTTYAGTDLMFAEYRSTGKTIVTSASHGLTDGDSITITGTTNYNGTYTISESATNTFKITKAFVADDATGTWVSSNQVIITSASHGLGNGASVTIAGTTSYNGTYAVAKSTANTFAILATFVATETGTWSCVTTDVTITSAGHTLSDGDTVVITSSTDYDGTYVIFGATTNTFNITATWTQTRTGTWTGGIELINNADYMFEEYGSAPGSDVILLTDEKLTLGDSAGQVYQYDDTVTTDGTVAIPARHITEIYDLALPSKNKLWPSITVTAKGTGLIVSYRTGNFETVDTGWVVFAEQALTSEFEDYTFTIHDTSRKIQFRFTNADGDDFEIANYGMPDPAILGGI